MNMPPSAPHSEFIELNDNYEQDQIKPVAAISILFFSIMKHCYLLDAEHNKTLLLLESDV
jgi:hypothetical protein